ELLVVFPRRPLIHLGRILLLAHIARHIVPLRAAGYPRNRAGCVEIPRGRRLLHAYRVKAVSAGTHGAQNFGPGPRNGFSAAGFSGTPGGTGSAASWHIGRRPRAGAG